MLALYLLVPQSCMLNRLSLSCFLTIIEHMIMLEGMANEFYSSLVKSGHGLKYFFCKFESMHGNI